MKPRISLPIYAWLMSASILSATPVQAVEQCASGLALDVPATSEGLYLNLVTGTFGFTEASVPGFDVDLYAAVNTTPSGQLKFYWGSAATGGGGVASTGDVYAVLGAGALVGPASLFTRAAFAGDTSVWQAGTSGYLGMRFRNESTGTTQYGWIQLTTTAALGFPATIAAWCYEDSGAAITIGGTATEAPLFANGFEP